MRHFIHVIGIFVVAAIVAPGCDSANSGTNTGPLTRCDLSIVEKNPNTGDYSEACESDADCDYGECMMPGDAGNLTNTQFGFCTRGCECGDDTASQLSDAEKTAGWSCIYPPTPAQHKRHLVFKCNSVADCQAFDSRWTSCKNPSSGGSRPVCHAE